MQFVFRITMILSLILCVNLAKADTFIVTTKADSGPGTLRDAINKANVSGTAARGKLNEQVNFQNDRRYNVIAVGLMPIVTAYTTRGALKYPKNDYEN